MAEAADCVAATVHVTVAYSPAAAGVQEMPLSLPAPACVADALQAAGLEAAAGACGIWGKVCTRQTPLQTGDRVELYRPLTVDPKVARRERFMKQGARSSGLFAKRRANSKAGY